jgi:hypothetical protein
MNTHTTPTASLSAMSMARKPMKPTPLVHIDSQQMRMDDEPEPEHRPNCEHHESGVNAHPMPTTRAREHAGK